MTELRIRKHCIEVLKKERYVSGSVNIYRVHFEFIDEWNGLTKVAVFKVGQKTREILLPDDCVCIIPWEVMTDPSTRFQVGVYGIRENEIIRPTIMANLGMIEKGTQTNNPVGTPPTPDIYQQILSELEVIKESLDANSPNTSYIFGHGLTLNDNVVSVNTVSNFKGDNTLPMTAAGVQSTVGNIEAILATI